MKTLEQVRNAFKSTDKESNNLPNNYYPFWNMKDGDQAVIRFLPDANQDNPTGFLVEKVMHTLTINGEFKSVPCLSMYNEPCPVCAVSQKYYKAEDKENGKKYWKKKQHIAQAIIVEDPLVDENGVQSPYQGQVKYVTLGFQLFGIIKAAFEDGELDDVPYAFEGGTDFVIKKTKQGDFATYSLGSKFARKSTDLDQDTVAAVQQQLIDLSTLLPKNPGVENVEGMLEAAMTGSEYSVGSSSTSSVTAETTNTSSVSVTADDVDQDDILAQIRNRRKQQA